MINRSDKTWHKVQDLLSEEHGVDDDTYKGSAKQIHNLFLAEGWTPPEKNGYRAKDLNDAAALVAQMSSDYVPIPERFTIAEGVLDLITKVLDEMERRKREGL